MRPYRALSAALFTASLGACGTEPAAPSASDASVGAPLDLVVVAQANVHGDIEPCG